MTLEPHVVEKGFIKRWLKQAFFLILKNPFLWAFMIVLYFFIPKLINHTIWLFFSGGFLFMLSLELVAMSDFHKVKPDMVLSSFKLVFRNFIEHIIQNKMSIILSCIFFYAITYYFDKSSKGTEVGTSIFSSISFATIMGYLCLNQGGGFRIFAYPIKRAFEIQDYQVIYFICRKAFLINLPAFFFMELGLFFFMIFFLSVFPEFGIFYCVFFPVVVYVAFREIFWGIKENNTEFVEDKKVSLQTSTEIF